MSDFSPLPTMGKKKDKVKKQRDTSKVEERAKQIANIQPPDENPHKKDNEDNIERYFRYGRMKTPKPFKSIKEAKRVRNK